MPLPSPVRRALRWARPGADDDGGDDAGRRHRQRLPGRAGARSASSSGYEVVVDEDTRHDAACRFEPADLGGDDGNGVDEGEPSSRGPRARRRATHRRGRLHRGPRRRRGRVGPTEALADGVVDGGRGWVARVGRVVQVGVARDRRLVPGDRGRADARRRRAPRPSPSTSPLEALGDGDADAAAVARPPLDQRGRAAPRPLAVCAGGPPGCSSS